MELFLITIILGAIGFAAWQSWTETYRSRFELPPLIFALEKLVSRASQLEDRSLKDADMKIIFNLRIAEAEAALEYADWVLRSNPVLLFFRRKSLSPSTRQYRSRHVSL